MMAMEVVGWRRIYRVVVDEGHTSISEALTLHHTGPWTGLIRHVTPAQIEHGVVVTKGAQTRAYCGQARVALVRGRSQHSKIVVVACARGHRRQIMPSWNGVRAVLTRIYTLEDSAEGRHACLGARPTGGGCFSSTRVMVSAIARLPQLEDTRYLC